MEYGPEKLQWQLIVSIFHGHRYGHRIWLQHADSEKTLTSTSLGTWRESEVPDRVVESARAAIDTAFVERLVTRYGVAQTFPLPWAGDPEPF